MVSDVGLNDAGLNEVGSSDESSSCQTVTVSVPVTFRDLQAADLSGDRVAWSGGAQHLVFLEQVLQRAWQGEVDLLVGELPTGVVVAVGAVDHQKNPSELWMLSVDQRWQSLGLGTALIEALENRVRQRGRDRSGLGVEWDNPRARALYRRLGYVDSGFELESWQQEHPSTGDLVTYVTVCTKMSKSFTTSDECAAPPQDRPTPAG